MTQVDFQDDGSGNPVLSNREFEQAEFSDLTVIPPQGKIATVENVKFINCRVSPGTCVITSDVVLDNVVFSNLDCGDTLKISSEATLRRVVVAGESPSSLVVQPEFEDDFVVRPPEDIDFQLDVSEFSGSVCIVGLSGRLIRKDSNRHVVVKSSWKNEVDWKALGIGPFSYWRIFLKKLSVFNVPEGVFSLPPSTDKHYSETIDEMSRMEGAGVCFT